MLLNKVDAAARSGAANSRDARDVRRGWLGRQDSNLGMADSKSAALPLGDARKNLRRIGDEYAEERVPSALVLRHTSTACTIPYALDGRKARRSSLRQGSGLPPTSRRRPPTDALELRDVPEQVNQHVGAGAAHDNVQTAASEAHIEGVRHNLGSVIVRIRGAGEARAGRHKLDISWP